MRLESLELFAFRNHARASLTFGEQLQLITGSNARGKTNLVEAIYVLATGRSFRRHTNSRDLIAYGASEASVRGEVVRDGLQTSLSVHLGGRTGRRLHVNGNDVHYVKDYVRHVSVVAFQPEDLLMVRGGPDLRRDFVDRAAFTLLPEYLDDYNRYQRALAGRNQLLKQRVRGDLLAAWTEELAETGSALSIIRKKFLDEFLPAAMEAFADIFRDSVVDLSYAPNPRSLRETPVEQWRQAFLDELQEREADDTERGFTGVGPHRDDIAMLMDGKEARMFASQGQTRALVLALRIGQIRHATGILGSAPLFILDDVGSELDEERRKYLARFLAEEKVQTFITATEKSLLPVMDVPAETWLISDQGSIESV